MFSEQTIIFVKSAVTSEFQHAVKNYGSTYNSNHESYAVLKEEIDEARDELIQIQNRIYESWQLVKIDRDRLYKDEVAKIKEHAEALALEACQIAAVCSKILNGDCT